MRILTLLSLLLTVSQVSIAQSDRPWHNPLPQANTAAESHTYPSMRSDPSIHSLPARSFYKSRSDWRHIIDSTWGPGPSLSTKLAIFDAYATAITNNFDGFLSLGLDWTSWDSLKNSFRSRIDSTTSRGTFASIMAQFAMSLRDGHTWAWDRGVTFSALSPGVPVLVLYPFAQADHFGAVLTALPDSTALVLRTVPAHPLGLQPGDIVLGYEGVPWKRLVQELLDADLPVFSNGFGTPSAQIHSFIRNVGNNWHLFDTIDIVKYSTGDTLHLSVQPLLNLPPDPMMGNEQLEISGIPFSFYRGWPFTPTGQLLQYGRLPLADVGYIRIVGEHPSLAADPLFAAAVDSLWNAQGLIIDLRWNSGGWSVFDSAFAKMFSQRLYTINDVYRANSGTLNLVPVAHSNWFLIPGVQGSIYDRPIAVLLGPTCVSDGEITAHRLQYHPMVRFFGKTTIGSHGDNTDVLGYSDWWLHYSLSDMYHLSQPGIYLNRREFPIDEPVWFNPDDVAHGIDPVVRRAVDWISTLCYAHHAAISADSVRSIADSIRITASVQNPASHTLVVSAIVKNTLGATVDSVTLTPVSGDSLWGAYIHAPGVSGTYVISVRTDDMTSGSYRRLPSVASFVAVITSGAISGMEFNDRNGNGRWDRNEPGISGWKIRLTGTTSDSALTSASGAYTFSNVLTGTYTVSEDVPSGWVQTMPDSPKTYSVVITTGSNFSNKNFGNTQLSLIRGQVFADTNQNGIKDSAEIGIFGVKIHLSGAGSSEAYSDFNGCYGFSGLTPGAYVVSEDVGSPCIQTFPAPPGTHMVVIPGDTIVNGLDFGIYGDCPRTVVTFPLNHGWNIISMPSCGGGYAKSSLFPIGTSQAFAYENGYVIKDTLVNGVGYWLKFAAPETVLMAGTLCFSDTVGVVSGWNLVGSMSDSVVVTSISTVPPGMISSEFFGYEGRYTEVNALYPGKGYWVKVHQNGKLILSLPGSLNAASRIKIVPIEELPPPPPDAELNSNNPIIPSVFSLEQNYPNPFNPTTVLCYQLPVDSWVKLKVYNILGQEVANLVDGMQDAGWKSIVWDARGVASGVYYYRLTAGTFTETKKLLLLR